MIHSFLFNLAQPESNKMLEKFTLWGDTYSNADGVTFFKRAGGRWTFVLSRYDEAVGTTTLPEPRLAKISQEELLQFV